MKCTICDSELIQSKVNHIVDFDNHIIIIKEVPALVCEQCGEYYLDNEIALKVENIIDKVYQNHAEIFVVNFKEMVA